MLRFAAGQDIFVDILHRTLVSLVVHAVNNPFHQIFMEIAVISYRTVNTVFITVFTADKEGGDTVVIQNPAFRQSVNCD